MIILAAILAAVGLAGGFALHQASAGSAPSTSVNLANLTGPSVDTIGCDDRGSSYHVHAHLTVLIAGRPWTFSSDDGHLYNDDCDYWLHRHDDENGIIHIEGPHVIRPTLKTWFDIMAKTSGRHAVPNLTPRAGQGRGVWVNMKRYHGKPLAIPLRPHTDITIEIGPPFRPPARFNFAKYQL